MSFVLFERFMLNRQTMNNIKHHSLTWKTPKRKYMIAFSWSTIRGDWWKNKNEEIAKFFSWEWRRIDEDYSRTGVYIGRIALVIQTQERGREGNEPGTDNRNTQGISRL